MTDTSTAIVVRAEDLPRPGIIGPGPHQRYRWPRTTIETRPVGGLEPDDIRVEMLLAGVCGTDLHVVRADPASGYILGSAPLEIASEGRVLGHEGVGRILAAGTSVRGLAPGQIVTFESIVTCQSCRSCRRGDFNQCTCARLIGLQRDGLFRTVADLPARIAHDVSDLADSPERLAAAACVEPASCAYVAVRLAQLRPGDRVVVFGAGPIGVFAAMLCRLVFGAAAVEVVEPIPCRRQQAAAWADRCFDVEGFFAERRDEDIDVVIEASGETANVDRVFGALAARARVVVLGRSGQPLTVSCMDRLITNGVTITGSRGHLGGAFDDVLRLYRGGRLPLHDAVTGIVDGLGGIVEELQAPIALEHRHVKLLARLA